MRGLFERLGSGAASERGTETAAVLAHLRVLLNSRKGSWAARPDYGLPDFTDELHDFPKGARTLQQAVRDAIAEFEPRLASITVRVLGVSRRAAAVHLEIHAQLVSRRDRVRFLTCISRSQVTVDP